ncbi:unnamed protein product, partial [Amoebophrya sp. A25]
MNSAVQLSSASSVAPQLQRDGAEEHDSVLASSKRQFSFEAAYRLQDFTHNSFLTSARTTPV